jgi:signal peptidase II
MTDRKPKNKKSKSIPNEDVKNCSSDFHCWPLMGMGLAGLIIVLDQISKWIVLNHLMVPPQTLSITSFFNIVLTWNRGVSFGLLSSSNPYGPWLLAAIASCFIAVIILWIWQAESKLMALAFGSVLGGAAGNLSDRLRFGTVTDFLDFHAFGYHWYTFNIADAAIVIGVALILLEYLKEVWSKPKNNIHA